MIKVIRKYKTYEEYIEHQKQKTLSKKSRERERREFDANIERFKVMFTETFERYMLAPLSAICGGSRSGAEVKALLDLGVSAQGYDLVEHRPYTHKGDIHDLPARDSSADLYFTNAFDHVLYPERFAVEVRRVLIPGGVCIAHLAVGNSGDSYRALEIDTVKDFVRLLKGNVIGIDPIEWRGALNRAVVVRIW